MPNMGGRLVRKNQEGTIILYVAVIIGIIGMLYTSIYVLMDIESRMHQSIEDTTKAYYLAESGIERGEALLKQGIITPFTCVNPFSPQYVENHQFSVTIAQTQPDTYTITSTGTYGDTKKIIQAVVISSQYTFSVQSQVELN